MDAAHSREWLLKGEEFWLVEENHPLFGLIPSLNIAATAEDAKALRLRQLEASAAVGVTLTGVVALASEGLPNRTVDDIPSENVGVWKLEDYDNAGVIRGDVLSIIDLQGGAVRAWK